MINKRGGIALRDIIFMVLIFSGIIAFASILVTDLGTEYGNANMTTYLILKLMEMIHLFLQQKNGLILEVM